ncbi:MurR/RpiR family transcriptional regulator [Vagococcus sp. PNs007]|uniref:MurR/RpiR family transcriptional regulator n=1 Tax=Vagococcus proximus TaxID=2991417 RepID=A0ABT5WY96_9ENTE|nr:MurR/RpiR family transcriptional regulator [Vagococcus proximus]MDF0478733.1 MurR/RpiR family transcriptional regulator [Vagococcus proximus]
MKNPIEVKINTIYRDISRKEQQVADYILNFPDQIIHQSIGDLSRQLGMAESTVFRFCQRLGYKGYKEFKIDLASVVQSERAKEHVIYEGITEKDSPREIAQKVFASNQQALQDTIDLLDDKQMTAAVNILTQSEKVIFFGSGGSNVIALDAFHKFLRSPLNVGCNTDNHIQLMESARMGEQDCAVIISHSGQSQDSLQIAGLAKKNGAKLIVITSFLLSPLAELSDCCLLSTSKEIDYRPEALATRLTQLSLIDALYVNVMYQNIEKSEKSLEQIRGAISITK